MKKRVRKLSKRSKATQSVTKLEFEPRTLSLKVCWFFPLKLPLRKQ